MYVENDLKLYNDGKFVRVLSQVPIELPQINKRMQLNHNDKTKVKKC